MPALLLTFVLVGVGWFLLIRPQQQRLKEQRAMVQALEAGDRVITAGGIHGYLVEVDVETVRIEVAPSVVLTLARPAIARRVDPTPPDHGDDAPGGLLGADDPEPGTTGLLAEDNVTNPLDGPTNGGPA